MTVMKNKLIFLNTSTLSCMRGEHVTVHRKTGPKSDMFKNYFKSVSYC